MKCEGCGRQIFPKTTRGRFCGSRCRTDAWVRKREAAARGPAERALRTLLAEVEAALSEARESLETGPEDGGRGK